MVQKVTNIHSGSVGITIYGCLPEHGLLQSHQRVERDPLSEGAAKQESADRLGCSQDQAARERGAAAEEDHVPRQRSTRKVFLRAGTEGKNKHAQSCSA